MTITPEKTSGRLVHSAPVPCVDAEAARRLLTSRAWDAITFSCPVGSPAVDDSSDRGPTGVRFWRRPDQRGLLAWFDPDAKSLGKFKPWRIDCLDMFPDWEPEPSGDPLVHIRALAGPMQGSQVCSELLKREQVTWEAAHFTMHWLLAYRLDKPPLTSAGGAATRTARDSSPLSYCDICSRPLTTPESAALGIGPDCLQRLTDESVSGRGGGGGARPRLAALAVLLWRPGS